MVIKLFIFKNKLAVWDLRKFNGDKSLLAEIEEPKPIKRVSFCPAKSDRYAILHENSTHVNVYRFEETNENLTRETINCKITNLIEPSELFLIALYFVQILNIIKVHLL